MVEHLVAAQSYREEMIRHVMHENRRVNKDLYNTIESVKNAQLQSKALSLQNEAKKQMEHLYFAESSPFIKKPSGIAHLRSSIHPPDDEEVQSKTFNTSGTTNYL